MALLLWVLLGVDIQLAERVVLEEAVSRRKINESVNLERPTP